MPAAVDCSSQLSMIAHPQTGKQHLAEPSQQATSLLKHVLDASK